MKDLIDPSSENIQTIPKKADDIYRIGLEHYVIGLNAPSRSALSTEQQNALLEISFNHGAKIDAIKSKSVNSKIFVKRPTIIGAQDTLITEPRLRNRTITLPIPSPEDNAGGLPSNQQIDSARLELLQLTVLSSHVVSIDNLTNNIFFEHNRFENMETYIHLGCEISHLLNKDNGKSFIDEFEAWG